MGICKSACRGRHCETILIQGCRVTKYVDLNWSYFMLGKKYLEWMKVKMEKVLGLLAVFWKHLRKRRRMA